MSQRNIAILLLVAFWLTVLIGACAPTVPTPESVTRAMKVADVGYELLTARQQVCVSYREEDSVVAEWRAECFAKLKNKVDENFERFMALVNDIKYLSATDSTWSVQLVKYQAILEEIRKLKSE